MTKRRQTHRLAAALATFALLATACGSDDDGTAAPPVGTGVATTTPTVSIVAPSTTIVVEASGGWIDGEPTWAPGGGVSAEEPASEPAMAAEASADASERLESPMSVESRGGVADEPTGGVLAPPVDDTPLRAGSVDDNVDYSGFLTYLERIAGLGISTRELDPAGRTIVTVVDESGRPVPGIELEASVPDRSDVGLITLRTTADGTARFHPGFYGLPTDGVVEFGFAFADMELVPAAAGEDITMIAPEADIASPVPLDVLFLLDATGSMGDEIDRLKLTIDAVAERVAALDPAPDVRFAMTLYRDEEDAFVTANYDFTGDVEQFRTALADVVADGGGDYPEALDEGLADALAEPTWRDPADAVQLIFVVADAPPQVARQVATPYTDSIRTAIARGIKIFPVASSESDDQAEAVFRQMAQATGAPFVFLSNGAGGAATGPSTDIDSTDYEELALDELVVRLIAEELDDLGRGGDVTVPTTIAPETTVPDGQ